MSLKIRYGFFLLLVVAILGLFCIATMYFFAKEKYILTVSLLVMLYLTTFRLGKRFSKIFLTLSFLRLLKQHNGVVSVEKYEAFIEKTMAGRRNREDKKKIASEILELLVNEKTVTVKNASILLIDHQ